ncbi:MAG: hypothetical protein RL196_783 [Actinomycetota bacterium]
MFGTTYTQLYTGLSTVLITANIFLFEQVFACGGDSGGVLALDLLDALDYFRDVVINVVSLAHHFGNLLAGIHNRCVIATE